MPKSSLTCEILEREIEGSDGFQRRLAKSRISSLDISKSASFQSVHDGGINWLSLDFVERRYLLASSSDSSVAAYDTANTFTELGGSKSLFKLDRSSPEGHKYSVSSAVWYPIDTGLFVTGSYDSDVKVWDTNLLQVACTFPISVRVNAVAMSSCASAHCLVGIGANDPEVKLCDPNTGSQSHILAGHKDNIWAISWSLQSEWELLTGSCDGQVRLWDIRASGTVQILSQYETQQVAQARVKQSEKRRARVRDPQVTQRTAHEGSVTAIHPTSDGLHWITAGTDSRVRLWDSSSFTNKLVNYNQTLNRARKARQIDVAQDAGMLFHPSGSLVQGLDLYSGQQVLTLKGHMDAVNAVAYNETLQELYTGSNDRQICIWSAQFDSAAHKDQDNWSP